MRAVLEEDGRIAAWWYREVTTPISTVFHDPSKPQAPKDVADWNGETPYDPANYRADYAPVLRFIIESDANNQVPNGTTLGFAADPAPLAAT